MPTSWFNHQTYVDTLNPAAVRCFLEVTHEVYYHALGDEFGATVPAIFTDEPQFARKECFNHADEQKDITLPWTGDFAQTYSAAYGQRIEDFLPELFWELPGRCASLARYRYHDHVTERFAGAFADQLARWCSDHAIALTGHMMEEPTLESQTHSIGEVMRSLRGFHLPGIDILCDRLEFTTAKQAQSIAHQFGREGVMSELYGVTGWDYDFVGHKAQGDWQAALGVTVRVPHLAWVSMAGEAKRDYPASIFYQSPWFRKYPLIEDHFARVAVALTAGKPLVRVGVIHPIESYWLAFGPKEQTQSEREERGAAFLDLAKWLLFGSIDFDYLCESLLPGLADRQKVGEMTYDAIVVPGLRTIRSSTLDFLEDFARQGGAVIFAGEIPGLVDARLSDRPGALAGRSLCVPWARSRILDVLEPWREIDVRKADGSRATAILHQIRNDGENRIVFLCHADRVRALPNGRIRLRGEWQPHRLDTFTGKQTALPATYEHGLTIIPWDFDPHGHLLLELRPGLSQVSFGPQPTWTELGRLSAPMPVTLSEPNVLLLDQAEWRIDEGPWQPVEETLRIENRLRAFWKLPPKSGSIAQPWADTSASPPQGHVTLRFLIESDIAVSSPQLALETPGLTEIIFDGRKIATDVTGWWVDEAIKTVPLPAFTAGSHELLLRLPFSKNSNLEWCYLLGEFGVTIAGDRARLTAPVHELAFGDWTGQGLPFFAGNVSYQMEFMADGRPLKLAVPNFKSPLLDVTMDGEKLVPIAFAPFETLLGSPSPGRHQLTLTAFGNRFNSFGSIHHTDPQAVCAPPAWRSKGAFYAREYQLRPMGILTAPILLTS